MFEGAFTALVTPFKDGKIDYDTFGKLIEFQIKNGIHGVVPCGTTGESATLSHQEHKDVIEFVVKTVNGRVPVIAGSGSNSTQEALELTEFVKKAGADGALVITPYYNKPTQEGLYRHFKLIAESVDVPIVVYNVPGRTGVNLLPTTLGRLKDISNIVAVKEASGSVNQAEEIIEIVDGKIDLLSGEDSLYFPLLAIGGKGMISVASNIIPGDVAKVYDEFKNNNIEEARNLFYETNPIPAKTALKLMGMISGEMRLPLCEMSKENEDKLVEDLKKYNLI